MSLDDVIKQNKERRVQERQSKASKTHIRAREFGKPVRKEAAQSKATLFVSNLHFDVTNAQLREKAQGLGKLVRLGINWDCLGKSKGTAELEYQTSEEAGSALEQLNGLELQGRTLAVKLTRED